jgi:hypothetical protein
MTKTQTTQLHVVIAEHGAWHVFFAALNALLGGTTHSAPHVDTLPDHIRKDIGLPPRGSPLPEAPVLPVRW